MPCDPENFVHRIEEKKPSISHKYIRDGDAGPSADGQGVPFLSPGGSFPLVMDRQSDTVIDTPDPKMPAGAVPQTADEHGHDKVEEFTGGAAPVPAQWNINILADPTAQRHVPAAPKVGDAPRDIGKVEVAR